MIDRRIHAKLAEAIEHSPAVGLLGPRQVGKTTLALEIGETRPSLYLDLESPADRAKLADAGRYLADRIVEAWEAEGAPEAATTPALGTGPATSVLNAPHALKLPVCWVFSNFSAIRPAPGRCASITGVMRR